MKYNRQTRLKTRWILIESQLNLTAITLITVVWTQNVIKLRHVSYCYIKIIKKRYKQQSLAGRIDKLGGPDPARGPEFENHWYTCSFTVL